MQRLARLTILTTAVCLLAAPLSCGPTAAPAAVDDAGGNVPGDAAATIDSQTEQPKDAAGMDASAVDATLDAAIDPCPIGNLGDGGTRPNFESELTDGIWLFGEGSTFTWVRFNYAGGLQGSADYLSAQNPGYFPCKGGIGLSTANASDGSAILQLPDACNNVGHRFEFLCIAAGSSSGAYANATLQATIRDIPPGIGAVPKIIKGYRYPKTQCAADMKTCGAP